MHLKNYFQLIFLCLLCLLIEPTWAQQRTVTGKVTDQSDGIPLSGVSVVVKGSSNGVNTGPDGTFKIVVPHSATLVFS